MTLESEYQRFSLVVDIFDLAVVEKTEGDVLGCLENHVACFACNSLEIDMKAFGVLP